MSKDSERLNEKITVLLGLSNMGIRIFLGFFLAIPATSIPIQRISPSQIKSNGNHLSFFTLTIVRLFSPNKKSLLSFHTDVISLSFSCKIKFLNQ